MKERLALYGFVRRKDGLRIKPFGIQNNQCQLMYIGVDTAAVVSKVSDLRFKPGPQDMIRHEEAVQQIFKQQVILPAKFPKIIGIKALERSLSDMETDLNKVLHRIVCKFEYHVRVFMTGPSEKDIKNYAMNEFSRFVLKKSSQFKYKHYFPLLTKEAKEAEFIDYAETVIKHISQSLCLNTTYWRGKSFVSDKVLMESFFWVRKHKSLMFTRAIARLKEYYPNLKFSVLGPTAPYNFVQLEFAEKKTPPKKG